MRKILLGLVLIISSAFCHGTTNPFFKNLFETMHITGYGFGIDGNAGFIYNPQNPSFTVHFGKDQQKKYQLNFKSFDLTAQLSFNVHLVLFVNTDPNFYTTDQKMELGWGISGEYYIPHSQKKLIAQLVKAAPKMFTKKVTEKELPEIDGSDEAFEANKKAIAKKENEPSQEQKMFARNLKTLPNVAIKATYIKIKNQNGGIVLLTLSPGVRLSYFDLGFSLITRGTITPLIEQENNLPID